MAIELNADGLERKYGAGENYLIGEFHNDGPFHIAEITLDYSKLPAVADNSVVIQDNFTLPKGSIVERVEIATAVDFDSAGDAMTLNIGWIDTDRTSNVDVDALVVAATQTELNAGGTNVAGWVGAEVNGSATTTAKLLTWEVDTAAATAGTGVVRIYYTAH